MLARIYVSSCKSLTQPGPEVCSHFILVAMAPQEKQGIVEMLEKSRREVREAVRGIPASHEKTSPGEGRWSALECMEHIAFVEGRFLSWLETAEKVESAEISKE